MSMEFAVEEYRVGVVLLSAENLTYITIIIMLIYNLIASLFHVFSFRYLVSV